MTPIAGSRHATKKLALCFFLFFTIPAFMAKGQEEKPPVNALRFSSQIVIGTVGGVMASLAGNYVGNIIFSSGKTSSAVCWTIGVTAGVVGIGELGGPTGSYNLAFLGSAVGAIPFGVWGYRALGMHEGVIFKKRGPKNLKDWTGILASPVLSATAFTLTRKHKNLSVIPGYDPESKMATLSLNIRFR